MLLNILQKKLFKFLKALRGQGGHFYVWMNHLTEWMWPIIHSCEKRINSIVDAHSELPEDKLMLRALTQLARENLLLQSSDWPFLITTY